MKNAITTENIEIRKYGECATKKFVTHFSVKYDEYITPNTCLLLLHSEVVENQYLF